MKKCMSGWSISLILIVTIIGIIVNVGKAFSGYGEPSFSNVFVSILFAMVWIVLSFYYGRQNSKAYLISMMVYFFSMLIITAISFLLSDSYDTLILFLIPAFTVCIPLYGFIEILPLSEQIAAISCLISMIAIIAWFF